MNASRYSEMLDVGIGYCCLVTISAIPPTIIWLNLKVYSLPKCSSLFGVLQPLIFDLWNVCKQDHTKKVTTLENSVDAM